MISFLGGEGNTGGWTQSLMLARQVLSTSPKILGLVFTFDFFFKSNFFKMWNIKVKFREAEISQGLESGENG
jgi:hypothetical protein